MQLVQAPSQVPRHQQAVEVYATGHGASWIFHATVMLLISGLSQGVAGVAGDG